MENGEFSITKYNEYCAEAKRPENIKKKAAAKKRRRQAREKRRLERQKRVGLAASFLNSSAVEVDKNGHEIKTNDNDDSDILTDDEWISETDETVTTETLNFYHQIDETVFEALQKKIIANKRKN